MIAISLQVYRDLLVVCAVRITIAGIATVIRQK
jgi:hypothetical protein